MYSALEIANYVIHFCIEHNSPISNLQLQKILYFIQRECLGKLNKPAFKDDIVAWKFGPVVEDVYHEYSGYSSLPITTSEEITIEDKEVKNIINEVTRKCMHKPAWELVEDTHRPGSAWTKVFAPNQNNVIVHELIKEEVENLESV